MTIFSGNAHCRAHTIFLVVVLTVLLLNVPRVSALTDEEYKKFMSESREFQDAEKELNTTWKQLMDRLSSDQVSIVKQAQVDWVKYVREPRAKELAKAKNLMPAEAYAAATRERIAQLRLFLPSAGDPQSGDRTSGG
ncbi:MAG: DUF1311 domain-containing protein, partial [Deltaproteobacteria bacterium]|nr:DUF1311 domain-containing protein [Deltaproteobacteria bacterium]